MSRPGTWLECTTPALGPYLAFLPDGLPPAAGVEAGALWALAEEAGYELGQLRYLERRLPAPDLLAIYPAIREAHSSARVEGTTTSLAQALGVEEVPADDQQQLDFRGIQDHLEAQAWATREVREHGLDLDLLLRAHEVLVRSDPPAKVEPGRWRSQQNFLPGERPGIEAARHVPPPPEAVPLLMADLERYLHAQDGAPRLVRAALVHAQFEFVHPFADGNGRMGRLLILLQFLHGGQLASPMLFLSDFFQLFREPYFGHLAAVARAGTWTPWVAFFLVGVAEVARAARAVAEGVMELEARLRAELRQHHQGRVGEDLLAHLFRHPRVTVAGVAADIDATVAATNTAVNRFAEVGWLRQVTPGRRNRVFVFDAYWQHLKDAGPLQRERIAPRLAAAAALPPE